MKKIYLTIAVISACITGGATAQTVSTFEDFVLSPGTYMNGAGQAVTGSFPFGNIDLPNVYQTDFGGYWSEGWAVSNVLNDSVGGYASLYASSAYWARSGANYGVGQQGSIVRITGADKGKPVKGMYVSNSTFAAFSMRDGDQFAKRFGGATGNDPDFFVLSIKAYNGAALSSDSVNFYLADFRPADNTQDYIIRNWTWVDLSTLGNADSLVFTLSSSDTGAFGINTPTFYCVDDIITDSDTADFEPLFLMQNSYADRVAGTVTENYTDGHGIFRASFSTSSYGNYWSEGFAISNMTDTTTGDYTNLYSAIPGAGYNGSEKYAVAQADAIVRLTPEAIGKQLSGFYITNGTYAGLSMQNGDGFAKKFGGATGDDPDYFVLTIKGFDNGTLKSDTVNFYLADFRFTDNSQDYIVRDWRWVDLSSLGDVDSIQFWLSSSDNGQFGMNTPAFFCLDNFTTKDIATGIATVAGKSNVFTVYPNPAKDHIRIEGAGKQTQIAIMDITGKVITEQTLSTHETVSLNTLPTGVYLLQITSDNTREVKRLIIE